MALSFHNLGTLCKNLGNLKKAEEFYLKSLKIRQNSSGTFILMFQCSLNHLGLLYNNLGNLEKAEDMRINSIEQFRIFK